MLHSFLFTLFRSSEIRALLISSIISFLCWNLNLFFCCFQYFFSISLCFAGVAALHRVFEFVCLFVYLALGTVVQSKFRSGFSLSNFSYHSISNPTKQSHKHSYPRDKSAEDFQTELQVCSHDKGVIDSVWPIKNMHSSPSRRGAWFLTAKLSYEFDSYLFYLYSTKLQQQLP